MTGAYGPRASCAGNAANLYSPPLSPMFLGLSTRNIASGQSNHRHRHVTNPKPDCSSISCAGKAGHCLKQTNQDRRVPINSDPAPSSSKRFGDLTVPANGRDGDSRRTISSEVFGRGKQAARQRLSIGAKNHQAISHRPCRPRNWRWPRSFSACPLLPCIRHRNSRQKLGGNGPLRHRGGIKQDLTIGRPQRSRR